MRRFESKRRPVFGRQGVSGTHEFRRRQYSLDVVMEKNEISDVINTGFLSLVTEVARFDQIPYLIKEFSFFHN